jgi:hypothetical protein
MIWGVMRLVTPRYAIGDSANKPGEPASQVRSCSRSVGQSKWGRHCCRPHSHRRVVFRPVRIRRCFPRGSTWQPMSFRVPEGPRSVTGARAGIRFHHWKARFCEWKLASANLRLRRWSRGRFRPWMVVPSGSLRPEGLRSPFFPTGLNRP